MFDTSYAKFYKKAKDQDSSEALDPKLTTLDGLPVELVVNNTPCGELVKPAKLKLGEKVNEAEWRNKGSSIQTTIADVPKAPTSTRIIIDAPGAKSVKIGKHEIDERDLTTSKGATLFELDCAPLTVSIDDKPLDVKLVDGAIEGVAIEPAKKENEKHEFVPVHDRTAAYLITTRADACYKQASKGFGETPVASVERMLSGGTVYKLAWADLDLVLEPMPDTVTVQVKSASEAARASAYRTAVWSVPCTP